MSVKHELVRQLAWFVVGILGTIGYVICAIFNVPWWAFVWLLALPLAAQYKLILGQAERRPFYGTER